MLLSHLHFWNVVLAHANCPKRPDQDSNAYKNRQSGSVQDNKIGIYPEHGRAIIQQRSPAHHQSEETPNAQSRYGLPLLPFFFPNPRRGFDAGRFGSSNDVLGSALFENSPNDRGLVVIIRLNRQNDITVA